MTQNIFNLYSAEAFAQHPMSLWSLDDDFSYLSLISANPVYTVLGGSSASVANPPTEKPQETVGIGDIFISIDSFIGSASATTITTQSFSVPDDIDADKPTVCINAFIYTYDTEITQLQIGFENSGNYHVKTYENLELNAWTRISHTVELPTSGAVTPYLNVVHPGSEKTYSLYQFSVGQWSEPFNHETKGAVAQPFNSISASADLIFAMGGALSASPSLFKVKEADVYGLSEEFKGYYFVENNKMLATNTKLPMVFGSGDITEIKSSEYGVPSIVFPGRGFLHANGKYKEITAEFWLKIYPEVTTKTKIFGPVASQDGLYVDKEFLILRVGPYEKSYFINKWYRPMLVDIRYTEIFMSVMINGEVVIEQPLVSRDVDLPQSGVLSNDWVGFYCTDEIKKFEIDCLAIYPYIVQEQVAKKKFVYGQGVGPADQVTRKFGATSFPVDFSFAKYSQNIIYPDMTKWFAGFYSNVEADSKFISLPTYELPEIKYLGNDLSAFNVDRQRRTWQGVRSRTWLQWLSSVWRQLASAREIEPLFDNFIFQEDRDSNFYIKLRPISSYNNVYGAIVFNSMNVLLDTTRSVFGLFSLNTSETAQIESGTEATIMHFRNNATGDTFKIIYDDSLKQIQYIYNATTIKSFSFTPAATDTYFIAGIDISDITSAYAAIIKRFFSVPQNIRLNVGGNDDDQFPGKIYRVTFNNSFFTQKDLSNYFDNQGLASYNGSVTLNSSDSPFEYVGNYTMLFKKANSSLIMDVASTGYWEDSVPLASLGTYILNSNGQRESYDLDIIQFNIDYPSPILAQSDFDSQNSLKTYVTLQRYEDVGSVRYGNYTVTKELDGNRYIDFDEVETNIDITKFNVVDGTIIFAPKKLVDFNDAYITVHMEIKSPGLNTAPIKLQRMSLASLAFDEASLYPINSSTGQKIYPFSRQGISYINKAKNPFLFYKDSTPYLYLTGDSGIQTLPYPEIESVSSESFRRGMSLPLNQNRRPDFTMHGLHMWCFYNKSETFSSRQRMFSISYQDTRYDFYLEPEAGGKRAKIVPYLYGLLSDTLTEDILMFQNGIRQEVYIYPLTWSLISLRFINPVDLSSIRGQLEIYPGTLFNNVAVFEQDIVQKIDDVFESYLGLSNIVAQDSSTLSVNFDEVNIFSDISFTTFTGRPV